VLSTLLPARVWERVLIGPARDVLERPGKQFRGNLVHLAWMIGGAAPFDALDGLVAAIEILHAGSLVIDDIEDNAERRRGQPALHRTYGMPVALNTGNWMYFVAFSLVERIDRGSALTGAMLRGVLACHAGQALDVGVDVTATARAELRAIVDCSTSLKAGALARLAAELGAIAGGADDSRREAIGAFAAELGTALQMLDDLGTVASASRADKAREDLLQLRPTWAWVWAAEVADDASWARCVKLARQRDEANVATLAAQLAKLGYDRGLAEIRARIARVRESVRALTGVDHDAVARVEAELARLEASYV
jgi:geranylgeranyl pyrophosphate synthase